MMTFETYEYGDTCFEYRRPNTKLDKRLISEMARLNSWYGLTTKLFIGHNSDTLYEPGFGVVLDKTHIMQICSRASLNRSNAYSVFVFALAHEQAHAFHALNVMGNKPALQREAHADFTAAFYIGSHLPQGQIIPRNVWDAVLAINTKLDVTHPTSIQRQELVISGMAQAAWNVSIRTMLKNWGKNDVEEDEILHEYLMKDSWDKVKRIMQNGHQPFHLY